MGAIIENVAKFGRSGGLIGVVCERAYGSDRGEEGAVRALPAVIILNTGIIHRVGIGRLSTIWARRMAREGHCVLRFDISGVGDSERRDDTLSPVEGALADVRDAVDWVRSARGISSVIMIGLCSGGDLALLYAGTDSRVVGLVLIDPSTPPTFRHYLLKFFNFKLWMQKFELIVSSVKYHFAPPAHVVSSEIPGQDDLLLSERQIHSILAGAYRTAFAQGTRILAVFTKGAGWYNYRDQLFDAFPEIDFDGNLQLEYLERCDHTITHEANRARLFAVTESWLARLEISAPVATTEPSETTLAHSAAKSSDVVSVEF
jgi:pimeloyl-ACP methyl ester carboxylesterase